MMKFNKCNYLIFLFYICFTVYANAQDNKSIKKELEQKLAQAKDDTTKQYYHFKLVWETFQEPKKLVYHMIEGGILVGNNRSTKEGYFHPILMQDSIDGILRELKAAIFKYHNAKDHIREALSIYLLANFIEDPNTQFNYFKEAQKLVLNFKEGKLKEIYLTSLEIAFMNCNFIGNDPHLNIQKAKRLINDFFERGDSLNAYAVMSGLSSAYNFMQRPDSALYYSDICFKYLQNEKVRQEYLLGKAQELLLFTGQLGMYDLCRYYAKYCIANVDTTDKYVFLSTDVYLKLALYYMNVEASAEDFSLKKAYEYLERARILISKKKSWQRQNSIHRTDYYAYLAEWAKLSGDYKLAYEATYKQLILLDSLKTVKNVESFNEMQIKYEVAKKEKDATIAQQKSKLQLTWFISIVIVISLVAIGLFFYMRNRNKIKTLEESIKIRNTISANLHDDVGSALSSISIISDMVKSVVTKNPEKANELIDKISETSNEVMSNMKDIVWSINPNNDHVENLLAKMREFAANVLENGKIEMIYNDQTAGKAKIDVVNRPEVYLIFKEAINNAAKYAKASLVEINIYHTAEHFCIEIFDNGIGFDKDKVEMGNGLINMQKRAEKIGAKFTIQSEINIGTKIKLIV